MFSDLKQTQQKSKFPVLQAMSFFAFLSLLFLTFMVNAQQHRDYIIKLNKDTVFMKVVRMHKKMESVICEENGRNIKHDPKDVLELKYDTAVYETGLVRLKRTKQFVFLRRTISGKLSLYETEIRKTKVLWRNFGEDLIRLRWAYRAQDWTRKYPVTVYFYKKEGESRENFSSSWKEKGEDCKMLADKIKSKSSPWSPTPKELVRFYNENCN